MAYKSSAYHDHSDPDDQYGRRLAPSPNGPPGAGFESSSPTDSESPSAENTPTTFTHSGGSGGSPRGLMTQWSAEQCADFISNLGLVQYADTFVDEAISGEALIALQHSDLKEMGMGSVGHRLKVLKAVYDVKTKQSISVEADHYVPLSADGGVQDSTATQDDITRIIRIIRDRDERITTAEVELGALKDDLKRITEENRRLREDILSLIRIEKDRFHPLPNPTLENGDYATSPPAMLADKGSSSLSRKFSKKQLFLGGAPKNPSPTSYAGSTMNENSNIDASAAVLQASKHLGAGVIGGSQPQLSPGQPSPSSPPYGSTTVPVSSRSYPRSDVTAWPHQNGDDPNVTHRYPESTYGDRDQRDPRPQQTIGPSRSVRNGGTPMSTAQTIDSTASTTSSVLTLVNNVGSGSSLREVNGGTGATGPGSSSTKVGVAGPSSGNPPPGSNVQPPNNPFKKFRVSVDDPCHKVLPVALKQYKIAADWRQYSLYIVHGDQERCLGLNERPLILFKQLDREGRKPMFMLRKHAAPEQGHVNTVSGVAGGASVSTTGSSMPVQIPGGML